MAGDESSEPAKPEPRVGSYRLVKTLGSGGMSSVFRAVHDESGVEVAVKILPRSLARNKTLLQRFLREARSAESLEHPNVVAIYDHGVDNGQYYLVLEYVSGGDLHDWVRDHGPMSAADAIAVVRATAEGLHFAAGRGLIHRDIKPANLLRTPGGVVKIADLGLALQAEDEDERVTREGTTVGTVDYMAPEQARDSRGTSERSDIYSLGCTFYYLLTGQPPYPGGDVTEKLTRHFTAPPPDPRDFRPDLPAAVSAIVRKMMAKRPELRYANYDELIAALDAVHLGEDAPGETLDALLVDDDADTPDPAPLYTLTGGDTPGPEPEPAPLYALVDDDGPASGGFLPLDLTEGERPGPVDNETRMAEVSMADLAAMIDDDAPAARVVRPPVKRPPSVARVAAPAPDEADPFHEEDEEALEGAMPGPVDFGSGRVMTDDERRWLKILVLGAVGLLALVIGAHLLFTATRPKPDPFDPSTAADPPAPAPEPEAPRPRPEPEPVRVPKVVAVVPKPVERPAVVPNPPTVTTAPAAWTEPADVVPETVPEAVYPGAVEARFRPDWAAAEIPNRLPGKTLTVRRLVDPRDPDAKSRLPSALEVIGVGAVELADNGPFFVEDLPLIGEARLVRARPGFRPVVCLEGPKASSATGRTAYIDVDSHSLTLDGLDLIVDARDLPPGFTSLFLVRGGTLTLRNCTVTVDNRGAMPVSVVQTGPSERPSRVRLERTLIRGAFSAAFDLASGSADIVVSRSAVVNGHGVAVTSAGSGTADRRVFVSRSVVATRGSAFEMVDGPPGVRPRPLTVRALGSTFTHLAAPTLASLLAWRGEGAGASELANWDGVANVFAGWSDWLSVGNAHVVRVNDLAGARTVWPGTDAESEETGDVRPLSVAADRAGVAALRDLAPRRPDVVSRVAVPTPMIHEKTVDPFPRPLVPGLTTAAGLPNSGPASPPLTPRPPPTSTAPAPPGFRELSFDAQAAPWSGDLGKFLASNVRPGDVLVRVWVTGAGLHPMSPVRLPAGVSLDLMVSPGPDGFSPSWAAARGQTAHALIDVPGGSLSLSGVDLTRGGSSALKRLVRVEGGNLVIHHCRLTARGPFEAGGGGLIEFNARGSRPSPTSSPVPEPRPFASPPDRPTCRLTETILITGGEAIAAEVGRGMVALSQCAVAAGPSAFTLRPGRVARHRFEADLWLDHCTVASERAFVTLGPWPGGEPGPDRPWLVSSFRSAFFSTFDRKNQDGVLLRVDPDAFARGALFWQASGDAFEVLHVATPGDAPLLVSPRFDLTRQLTELWGQAHVHTVSGPRPSTGGSMTRRLVTRLLKPGDVYPGDLALDPTFPREDPPKDLGADLARLGITPSPRAERRR